MKLWRIAVLVILGILISAGLYQWYEKRAQARRDTAYQAALTLYSVRFRLGHKSTPALRSPSLL